MSNIQWCDITANPIHLIREDGSHGGHWCRKTSPGCANCYAESQNQSNYFKFASKLPYSGEMPKNLIFDEKVMQELVKMRSPKKVFLGSMTDLFGNWVQNKWLDKIFAYMALAPQHTFKLLTKQPERMRKYLNTWAIKARIAHEIYKIQNGEEKYQETWNTLSLLTLPVWPLPNIWLGTSVENQKAADSRIPEMLQTPAKVRFLSCEPLLENIDLRKYLGICVGCQTCEFAGNHRISKSSIDWVIVGGESGTGARPCHVHWIRLLVTQCQHTETAVFVKQLGSVAIESSPYITGVATNNFKLKLKDRKGGDLNEFPEDLKIREFPKVNN